VRRGCFPGILLKEPIVTIKQESDMETMKGKVAMVPGAASGIGLATSKAFAQARAWVALADWDEKAVKAAG
jgi:hypothetical protein